jgi:hypothetical protein
MSLRMRAIGEKSERSWIAPLGDAALTGFVGAFVKTVEPYTEADPAALAMQFLGAFGNAVGRTPHTMAGAERHGLNLNAVIVGRSAKSRKGSSWAPIVTTFQQADPGWVENRVKSGLSSGEGLVHQVRDGAGEEDEGEADKRLLVVEAEFARVLKIMGREGNVLSTTLRDAWDGRPLGSLTKSTPTRASRHHISVIAHITEEELRRELTATDAANGFANRFLFIGARRARLLPSPPRFEGELIDSMAHAVRDRLEWASGIGFIERSAEADEFWADVYCGELAREWRGLVGALTARSEAQVLRLSAIYALVDGSQRIERDHVEAALAIWRYSVRTVKHIFGDALGDTVADKIRNALLDAPDCTLSRSEISNLLSRHAESSRVQAALDLLEELEIARKWNEPTAGRPIERWSSCET